MALNGLEPVIIFTFYLTDKWSPITTLDPKKWGEKVTLQEWQEMGTIRKALFGILPIPIYLGGLLGGEQLTGIALDEADQTMDFTQQTVGTLSYQKNLANDVSLTFRARRDNPIMIALLAVIARLVSFIPTQRYSITMYYDSIFVLDGAIKSISQQTIDNTNIKLVQIIISERPPEKKDETSKALGIGGNSFLPNI